MALVPVAVALDRMLAGIEPLPADNVVLSHAAGRVLASPAIARRSQPSFAASAMDGYALRSADAPTGARLRVIGTAAAGHRFAGVVGVGEAVRIFTGAPLPDGADAVLVQESAAREGPDVLVQAEPHAGHNVRPAGLDFAAGDELLRQGTRLGSRELALAAAGNCGAVLVHRSPRVAVLSIGDELVPPGAEPGPDQTIASNALAIAELAAGEGAVVEDLGIARDEPEAVAALAAEVAGRADVIVTIGGASVGDHDITREALARAGMALDFWRVAMRPGRPLAFGRLGALRVLGFPGNPVSSFVCGLVFLRPLLRRLAGRPLEVRTEPAVLGTDLPPNGPWIGYLRARLERGEAALPVARPLPDQDSSLLRVLAEADALLVRPADAPAAAAGSPCVVLPLP